MRYILREKEKERQTEAGKVRPTDRDPHQVSSCLSGGLQSDRACMASSSPGSMTHTGEAERQQPCSGSAAILEQSSPPPPVNQLSALSPRANQSKSCLPGVQPHWKQNRRQMTSFCSLSDSLPTSPWCSQSSLKHQWGHLQHQTV